MTLIKIIEDHIKLINKIASKSALEQDHHNPNFAIKRNYRNLLSKRKETIETPEKITICTEIKR